MRAESTTRGILLAFLVFLSLAPVLNAGEIHEAVKAGDAAKVQALLDEGAYVNSTPDDGFGWTPLHFAIAAGDTRIAEILLARGANLTARAFTRAYTDEYNAAMDRTKYGQSIHDAPVVTPGMKYLYAGAHTVLDFVVVKKDIEMVRLLLSKGADVNLANGGGWTPLHMAADAGDSEMASLLLRHGARLEARDFRGLTPWEVASWKGHQEMKRLLAPE